MEQVTPGASSGRGVRVGQAAVLRGPGRPEGGPSRGRRARLRRFARSGAGTGLDPAQPRHDAPQDAPSARGDRRRRRGARRRAGRHRRPRHSRHRPGPHGSAGAGARRLRPGGRGRSAPGRDVEPARQPAARDGPARGGRGVLRRGARHGGDDSELNDYFLAGVGGGTPPPAAPPDYVEGLFDDYSDEFDAHLVGVLGYRGPQPAGREPARAAERRFASVLDLGCGTGLCGPLLKPRAGAPDRHRPRRRHARAGARARRLRPAGAGRGGGLAGGERARPST